MKNKTSGHEVIRPRLVPLRQGQEYSRQGPGGSSYPGAVALEDGVAVDGVFFSVEEYAAPLAELERMRRGKKKITTSKRWSRS